MVRQIDSYARVRRSRSARGPAQRPTCGTLSTAPPFRLTRGHRRRRSGTGMRFESRSGVDVRRTGHPTTLIRVAWARNIRSRPGDDRSQHRRKTRVERRGRPSGSTASFKRAAARAALRPRLRPDYGPVGRARSPAAAASPGALKRNRPRRRSASPCSRCAPDAHGASELRLRLRGPSSTNRWASTRGLPSSSTTRARRESMRRNELRDGPSSTSVPAISGRRSACPDDDEASHASRWSA